MSAEHLAFKPKVSPLIPIVEDERQFPVNRIFCVGRNYAEHAREMGNDPDRDPPFFFLKSLDALVPGGGAVTYPMATNDLHHEIEMIVAIGLSGSEIAKADALGHVFGYAIGLWLFQSVGLPLIEFYGSEGKFEKFKEYYHIWGGWIVAAGGFTPLPYKVITIASGVTKLDLGIFILASVVSRGLRFYIIAALLYRYGDSIKGWLEKNLAIFTLLFFVFLVGAFLILKVLI